jgi:hypothetical protein
LRKFAFKLFPISSSIQEATTRRVIAAGDLGRELPMTGRERMIRAASLFAVLAVVGLPTRATALPSFARQTGQECSACHVGGNYPQLTAWGRWFKLTGYSAGNFMFDSKGFNYVPLGVWGQVGATWAGQPKDASGNAIVVDNGAVALEQVVFEFGTKITDWAGIFYEAEVTYTYPGYVWAAGPVDFRAAYAFHPGNSELLVGFDMNNGPTESDVWSTLPFWGYPYYMSPLGQGLGIAKSQLASLGNLVGSLGLYAMFNREIYAEFALYTVGNGFFRWGTWGPNNFNAAGTPYVDGWSPYWRAYWTKESGASTFMLGTVGLYTQIYPAVSPHTGPADSFTDVGFDAEYQWITDRHKVTLGVTYIHEWQSWNGSRPLGLSSIQNGSLNTLNLNAAYNYDNHWNLSAGYFLANGSNNASLYSVTDPSGATISTSPNTSGYVLEADYFVTQNLKFALQYVGYFDFNGLTTNIDGQGRFATDNNTLWFNLFIAL